MKVVLATTGYPPDRIGGVETVVALLAKELPKLGYETHVITRLWHQRVRVAGVTQLPVPRGEALGLASFGGLATAIVGKEVPDVLHCHGLEGAMLCNYPRLTKAREIFHLHTPFTRKEFLNTLPHRMGNRILARACFSADLVLCPSQAAKEDALRYLPGIDPGKVTVLHNPVMTQPPADIFELASLRKVLKLEDKKVILFVGKLRPEKGIEDICRAYQLLGRDDTRLLVVGAVGGRLFYEHLRRTFPDVIFTGFVANPLVYYQISDLFCIYSSGFESGESFAITLAQALMMGVPVVCADNHIFREVTGGHASFAPPRNPGRLSLALEDVLTHHEEARLRANAGARLAKEEYSLQNFMKRVISIYRRVSG